MRSQKTHRGRLATLMVVMVVVLLTGCAKQRHPESAAPRPPANGTTAAVVPLAPEMLIGSWTLADVADPGAGKILRLATDELHVIGSHCGTLGGTWRANDEGIFVADVWSASAAVVEGTPGCAKASQETPGWLRSVIAYRFDGAGPVLLNGRGQVVARLIPGATPTPEPDKADSVLEPPVVTDDARRALAPAVPLPATLVAADQRKPVRRWAPASGHDAAYVEFAADGEWHGSDGCNDESGRWITAAGGTMLATARPVTLAFCAGSVPIGQWLSTARRAGLDGEVLVLLDADGDETGRLSPTN
jgi:heat shock protein HslJ